MYAISDIYISCLQMKQKPREFPWESPIGKQKSLFLFFSKKNPSCAADALQSGSGKHCMQVHILFKVRLSVNTAQQNRIIWIGRWPNG